MLIDFIGVGAQKAGTSWIYACLYEHPQICAPLKELHFFSRPRFAKGKTWYEHHFRSCKEELVTGEFSTSYLYSEEAAQRIAHLYPEIKIIAVLRNPIERAYSQYRNSIKAGEIGEDVTFESFIENDKSATEQGMYAEQLQRYMECFSKERVLVLVYEDIAKDPAAFMKRIYQFLGVDDAFVPTMLNQQINIARTPKSMILERSMHRISEFLRKIGLDTLVWELRKLGVPDALRSINTKKTQVRTQPQTTDLKSLFESDVEETGKLIRRDLRTEWFTQQL